MKKLVAAEVFGIRMLDNETYEVDYKYEIESGKRDESMRVSMNDKDNYTVWCIENQQEIFINDNKKEFNKYVKEIVVPAGEMPNSLIFCPIFYQENVIGVITVQSFKKNDYQERALNIIKTLSAYCGIAYSNAQRLDALAAKLKKKN